MGDLLASVVLNDWGEMTLLVPRAAAPSLDEAFDLAGLERDEDCAAARLVGVRPADPLHECDHSRSPWRDDCGCGVEVRLGAPGSVTYWRIELG